MKLAVKIILGVVLLLAAGFGYFLWRVTPKFPDRPFVTPTGPYGVGTREYTWTDPTREERYTTAPGDRRTVVAQVWYPTNRSATGDTARYLPRPAEFASRLGGFAARKSRTNSVVDAAIAADGPFPVLVYNHGGGWTRWSATFATEWLASHGYVVFSVEHFGFNQTVKYPDGTAFTPDTLHFPDETGDGTQDALASWAYLDDPVFLIWKADARFALDRIEDLNRDIGPFQGALDLDRVGMFGWSFGGALSIQLTRDDPRIKAAVDHDGQLFGDVRERGTTRPIMQFFHGVDDALAFPEEDRPAVQELIAKVASWDTSARAASTADWYSLTIADTDHGDFSDLSLFYPRVEGRLDARRAHDLINAYTLAFFDHYLRGRPSDLLTGPSPINPEVTFHLRPAPTDSNAAVPPEE